MLNPLRTLQLYEYVELFCSQAHIIQLHAMPSDILVEPRVGMNNIMDFYQRLLDLVKVSKSSCVGL